MARLQIESSRFASRFARYRPAPCRFRDRRFLPDSPRHLHPEPLCSGGIALPSSLLLAHEPLLMPLPSISFALYEGPLPLVPSTAGHQELPDFILLIFPRVPRPLPRRSIGCTRPVLLRQLRPSQPSDRLGFPRLSHKRVPVCSSFRGCRHSVLLWPSSLVARLRGRYNLDSSSFGLHPRASKSLSFLEDSLPPPQSSLLRG